MQCEEELIRKLSAALIGAVDADMIHLISGRLSQVLADYDVTPKTRAIEPSKDVVSGISSDVAATPTFCSFVASSNGLVYVVSPGGYAPLASGYKTSFVATYFS